MIMDPFRSDIYKNTRRNSHIYRVAWLAICIAIQLAVCESNLVSSPFPLVHSVSMLSQDQQPDSLRWQPMRGYEQIPSPARPASSQSQAAPSETPEKSTTGAPATTTASIVEALEVSQSRLKPRTRLLEAPLEADCLQDASGRCRRLLQAGQLDESSPANFHRQAAMGNSEEPDESQENLGGSADEDQAPASALDEPREGVDLPDQPQGPTSEADERAEQEAAEASEAEAANKSALDEQQQAQREIIMAQAKSEAKAIRDQQEALMMQQRVQQQMLLKRQHELANADLRGSRDRPEPETKSESKLRQSGRSVSSSRSKSTESKPEGVRSDIQFSDQLEPVPRRNKQLSRQDLNLLQANDDEATSFAEAGEDSIRRPAISEATNGGDLLPLAQHHYGAHYDSLHGHQKHYYQFAESHKKGQFDSGYKRGGKKFQISGHSSQHKSHAEGHVKWHGKKGKGVQYWDYKHKGKKHHGYGHY